MRPRAAWKAINTYVGIHQSGRSVHVFSGPHFHRGADVHHRARAGLALVQGHSSPGGGRGGRLPRAGSAVASEANLPATALPLSRLLLVAYDHLTRPRGDSVDAIQTRARHEVVQLERGLVVLEIVVGIAPLLGLVGTVHGP